MGLLNRIDRIPLDVATIIKEFIPMSVMLVTRRMDYMSIRLDNIGNKPYTFESYIQKLITRNLHYIFKMVITYKYNHWSNISSYRHGGYKYGNYIRYLEQLCVKQDVREKSHSTSHSILRCSNIISQFEKRNGIVRKKKHKKIRRIDNTQ